MEETKISLKRNSFILFTIEFLLIIIPGIIILAFIADKIPDVLSYLLTFVVFLISLAKGIFALKDNNEILIFSDNELTICKTKKKQLEVISKTNKNDIKNMIFNEKPKSVIFEMQDDKKYSLFEFSAAPLMYNDLSFKIRATLCKYYPEKAQNLINEDIKEYLETGTIPEYIKKADSNGKAATIGYLVLLIILGIIPVVLALLSTAWLICELLMGILQGIVHILQMFV